MNAYLTAPYERVIKTTFRLDAEDNQKHRLRKRFSSLMRSSTTQSTAAAGDDDDDNDDPDELQAMKRKATQLYKAYAEHEETSPPSSCAAGENGNNLKQVREEEEDDVDQIPGPLAYLQRTSPENQGTCSFSCHVLLACLLASCLIPIFTYKYSVQWKQETAVLLDNANARANASSSLSFSSEQQAFPLLLENHAKEEWDTLQEVLQSQADAMTADILQSTNAPFPYHALSPYWEKTGQHVRKQVPFLQTVGWAPLMVDANRMDNWQRFALYQQSSWLSKSYELAGMDAEKNSDTSATTTITSSILNTNETTTDQHVFLPVAQLSPPPNNMSNPNLLQADLLTHFQGTNTMLDSFNVPGTSDFFNFTVSDILPNNSSLLQLANLNTRDEHHYSLVLQPVFDSFHDKEKVLKAVIFAIVSWEEFLLSQLQIQQLQSQLQPIHDDNTPEALLFLSSCSNKQVPFPSSASSIATATATAMDPIEMDHSDIHIIEFDTGTTNTNTKTQPGSCRYTLQVQIQTDSPSKTRLNEPLLSPTGFALIMAAVLLLLGCFLWILIIHLQWRYYQLHTLATSATNVLATMFPAKVCDRILNEELEKQQRRQFHDGISSNSVVDESDVNGGDKGNHVVRCMQTTKPNDRSQSFGVEPPNSMDFSMRDNCDSSHHENYDNMILKTVDQSNKYKTKPIADLFPEATGKCK